MGCGIRTQPRFVWDRSDGFCADQPVEPAPVETAPGTAGRRAEPERLERPDARGGPRMVLLTHDGGDSLPFSPARLQQQKGRPPARGQGIEDDSGQGLPMFARGRRWSSDVHPEECGEVLGASCRGVRFVALAGADPARSPTGCAASPCVGSPTACWLR